MLGHRELTMEDYADNSEAAILADSDFHRAFLVIGVALTYVVSPRYESQTLILIEQQKVPEDYVKPVVEEDISSRLASMKEQILSRSRIEPIINQYNLYSKGGSSMDDRVDNDAKGDRHQGDSLWPVAGNSRVLYHFRCAGCAPGTEDLRGDYLAFCKRESECTPSVGGRYDCVLEAATRGFKEESRRAGREAGGVPGEVFRQASRPAAVKHKHASVTDDSA